MVSLINNELRTVRDEMRHKSVPIIPDASNAALIRFPLILIDVRLRWPGTCEEDATGPRFSSDV